MSGTNGVDLRGLEFKIIAGFALEKRANNTNSLWETWEEVSKKVGYSQFDLLSKAYYLAVDGASMELDGVLKDLTRPPKTNQPKKQKQKRFCEIGRPETTGGRQLRGEICCI
ncbi:hypothetical protein BSKO_04555 [Bryopsis sp. KO-2023]|nr:hypothetical protein BSKO_04555 [Bryopsis sp. KO-2023]